MPKCDFNKVARIFIEVTLRHGSSPVNFLQILRTPLPKNTSGRLLPNLKFKLLFFQFQVTIPNLKIKNFHFELLKHV